MGLGAYSVVRYADDLSDQRINLGVLLWHPNDGFRCRFSSSVDRVQAIDPRITVRPLKKQLDDIKVRLTTAPQKEKELLDFLCSSFRYGLVISSPYPARISSADEMLNHLFDLLVSPVPEIRRASSQRAFESHLKKTIETSIHTEWPKARVQQVGRRNVKGIPIDFGTRTQIANRAALWHPLSLQSETRSDAQLASAKSTVLDIFTARTVDQYRRDKQYVALQAPRTRADSKLGEIVDCLEHAADKVFIANDDAALMSIVHQGLRSLQGGSEARRH
jgi:hypothetical protein